MTDDYPYPPDEFDEVPSRTVPQGVHRAPRSRRRRALPFVLVLLTFPLLAYGAVTWWSAGGSPVPTLLEPPVAEEPGGPAPPEPTVPVEEPTPAPPQAPPPEAPELPEPPVEPPPAQESPAPEPTPDLDLPVEVYNATTISGLAARAAERVQGAGFGSVVTGNWRGGDVGASTVFYGSPQDAVTARAVADALGIATVVESPADSGEGVAVVLTDDDTA